MRSTLTDLDILPRVYLFLRGGKFHFPKQKQVCPLRLVHTVRFISFPTAFFDNFFFCNLRLFVHMV